MIQSTIIARSLAAKTGQLIDNNKEVASQGLSNIAGSFLSCFPACGSFNRSAANLEAGAITPLAGIVSALALALLVFTASPLIARLPMPVMAGILFIVAAGLIKIKGSGKFLNGWRGLVRSPLPGPLPGGEGVWPVARPTHCQRRCFHLYFNHYQIKDIKRLLSIRGEARIIFVITLITALYGNLADGVFLGVFLSIVAYLRSVSVPEIELLLEPEAEQYRPAGVGQATVLKVSGSLFFGSVAGLEKFLVDLNTRDGRQEPLVVICEQVQNMDQSALDVLAHETLKRREAGGDLFLWLGNHKLDAAIRGSRLQEVIGDDHLLYHARPTGDFWPN